MEELIGKIIKSVTVYGDYQDEIKFETDERDFCYRGYGDCCSETYFSDVWNVQNILSQKVVDVVKMELMEGEVPYRKSRQEED